MVCAACVCVDACRSGFVAFDISGIYGQPASHTHSRSLVWAHAIIHNNRTRIHLGVYIMASRSSMRACVLYFFVFSRDNLKCVVWFDVLLGLLLSVCVCDVRAGLMCASRMGRALARSLTLKNGRVGSPRSTQHADNRNYALLREVECLIVIYISGK